MEPTAIICAAVSQANQGAGEGIAGAKTETDEPGAITKAVIHLNMPFRFLALAFLGIKVAALTLEIEIKRKNHPRTCLSQATGACDPDLV